VVVVLAVVVIFAVARARGWFRGEVRGPGGSRASVEGGPPTGVRGRNLRSGRDLTARGPSVDVRGADAGRDMNLEADGPGCDRDPKG
jgi:hypothetical protein